MNKQLEFVTRAVLVGAVVTFTASAQAVVVNWTDWTAGSPGAGTAVGTITTPTSTVSVDYSNSQGYSFIQTGNPGDIDYYQNNRTGRNPATSPYTSSVVDNIPTGTDIVALRYAGTQTLTFSETIANPFFSYVSLNGNGYAFDQDFDILSFGNPSDGNDCGYWGCGTSYKDIVDIGGGVLEYRLLGTGEPHGTLRFTGAFDTVSWRSLSNENWNGFTVGIEGTAQEILFGEITGVKWEDLDGDGINDAGEPGLSGWVIELLDDAGSVVATTTTDANGDYWFTNVVTGSYTVREILLSGWTQTFDGGSNLLIQGGDTLIANFGNRQDTLPPPDGNAPAPATLALMGLGLAGIGCRRKRVKAA